MGMGNVAGLITSSGEGAADRRSHNSNELLVRAHNLMGNGCGERTCILMLLSSVQYAGAERR
jgi:hypothetical protein